jgi:hypothetical protein
MQQHVWRVVPGVFWGAVVGGFSYWLLFPKGIHTSRSETAYWLFLLTAAALIWRLYNPIPDKRKSEVEFDELSGYWRLHLAPFGKDICFATSSEQDKVPRPLRMDGEQVIGRIHCIVEDGFWVWREER